MNLRLLGLFCATFVPLARGASRAPCDGNLIHLYGAERLIASPESRPGLDPIVRTLDKIENVGRRGRGTAARIYAPFIPEIRRVSAEARRLRDLRMPDQDEVFGVAYRFGKIVDTPTDFANRVGYLADGFDYMLRFNEREYRERVDGFLRTWVDEPVVGYLPDWSAARVRGWRIPRYDLRKTDFAIASEPKAEDHDYFFQYRYVLGTGQLPLRTLIEDRERGVFHYGVSTRPFAPHDGQHGNANSFLNHDVFHAFVAKHQDAKLFERLGIGTVADARRVKRITHRLLRARLEESYALADERLRRAVEMIWFGVLHEQGLSYPLQLIEDLRRAERRAFYVGALSRLIPAGEFGARARDVMGPNPGPILDAAMEWIVARGSEDEARFHLALGR